MFNIQDINVNFSFSTALFILGIILITAYTVYSYRYTTPPVNPKFKLLLIGIRAAALFLVLLTIFEPILSFARKEQVNSKTLVFIDDSKSIINKDSSARKAALNNSLNVISNSRISDISQFYTFGNSVKSIGRDSLTEIPNAESSTDFSEIFNNISKDEKDLASIVIISDGVITEGSNPVYSAEKLGVPVYTLGIGDTVRPDNVQIRRVLFNEYIYAETPTTINASIMNKGFQGKTVTASLYEENRLVSQNQVSLSTDVNSVNFDYTPGKPGEKKMMITLSELPGEATFADNKHTFYINVLNNKLNVLLIAGSPSPDLSFIKGTLTADENLKVRSITQVNASKFVEPVNQNRLIDSSDILFLIGFPAANSPEGLYSRIISEISVKNKPYFLVLSEGTDLNKLRRLQAELPFLIQTKAGGYNEVQPQVDASDYQNPLLQNNAPDVTEAWNNLPPVYRLNHEFSAKPESNVLSKIRINNIPINSPLILSRKLGNKRSIAVTAKDIWKWKLQTSQRKLDLFDSFILNSVKWLNTREDQKLVSIKPSKKTYSIGEPVEFTAQVYNETFDPVTDAQVDINVTSGKDKYSIHLNSIGNGIYEGTLITSKHGDYSFSGKAKLDNRDIGKDDGKFSIGDVEIEMLNTSMDKDFLNLLANQTGGKYYPVSETDELIASLESGEMRRAKERFVKSEVLLWSSEWMLVIIVILFAIEWFLRKRAGML